MKRRLSRKKKEKFLLIFSLLVAALFLINIMFMFNVRLPATGRALGGPLCPDGYLDPA